MQVSGGLFVGMTFRMLWQCEVLSHVDFVGNEDLPVEFQYPNPIMPNMILTP